MKQWRKSLFVASAGILVAQGCFSSADPFFPMFLQELGVRGSVAAWAGVIASIQALATAIMSPVWGSLGDRFGRRLMVLRAGIGMSVASLVTAAARSPLQLGIIRGVTGLVAGYLPASTALIASTTPQSSMTYALGRAQMMSSVGLILGPLAGGLCVRFMGARGVFLAAGAVLLVSTCIVVWYTKEDISTFGDRVSLIKDTGFLLKHRGLPALFVVQVLSQIGLKSTQMTLPLYVTSLVKSNPAGQAGIVLAVGSASMALGAFVLGCIRRRDVVTIYKLALVASSIAITAQGFSGSVARLAILGAFHGFAAAAVMVSANVLAVSSVEPSFHGRVVGLLNLVSACGWMLGPVLGGFAGDRLGLPASFLMAGLGYLAAWAVVCARFDRSSDPYRTETAS